MTALSKLDKDRIVKRIMADIPADNIVERARDAFVDAAVKALPPKVRVVYDDPETRRYVRHARFDTNCSAITGYAPAYDEYPGRVGWPLIVGQEAWEAFMQACRDHRAQRESRDKIKEELEANFASIRTVKVFTERFPELVKYLPERNQPVANLPATTALIDRLKAAGLPADPA